MELTTHANTFNMRSTIMKTAIRWNRFTPGLALLTVLGAHTARSQITVSVDMDTSTPGVQSTRDVTGPFVADLVMNVGAGGVSSFGISLFFDNLELLLNGSLNPTDALSAATESTPPPGMFNFSQGVDEQSNTTIAMPGRGHIYTFEAATLGNGPVNSSFSIGTIRFTVPTVLNDGLPDVELGTFNFGRDGIFDNLGLPVAATFNPGFVVPEPGIMNLLALASIGTLLRRRARSGR